MSTPDAAQAAPESEHQEFVADARRRLGELRMLIARLWPDRDDAFVLSELTTALSQLRQCEKVVADANLAAADALRDASRPPS
jgi:hypothetical protein